MGATGNTGVVMARDSVRVICADLWDRLGNVRGLRGDYEGMERAYRNANTLRAAQDVEDGNPSFTEDNLDY